MTQLKQACQNDVSYCPGGQLSMQSGDLSIPDYRSSVIVMNMPPNPDIAIGRASAARSWHERWISDQPNQ